MAETQLVKLAESIFDAVCSKGKEKAASFIGKKQDEQELKEAIQAFLDDFCESNLPCLSLDQEIDFEGFSAFLFSRQERLEEYFYGKTETRSAVLEVLRGEVLAYAKPRGQSGRRLVLDCLDAVLAVIGHILLKRVDTKDLFLASRTEKQILESVEKIVKDQAERIHSHINYRGSFQELVDGLETELPDDDRVYHYKNSRIGFFGREKELKELDDFLDDEAPFLFTVITGPGGIGKSKLLYHYVRINRKDSAWKMLFPSRDIVETLYSRQGEFFFPENLLIVVDYAGQYPEEIGKWMARIVGSKEKPHKMRLVLLERPSPEQNTKPEWYKRMVDRRKALESCLWKKQFHELELMDRDALMALMDNIAGQEQKVLNDQNRQDIYERVCSFHHQEEGGSPLYTILTTDAFLNQIPLNSLDTNKLMEYVLNRDEEYWETTICGSDPELYRCFKEMLVYATATGGWDFTPLREPLTEEAECLRKISRQGKSAVWEKFSQIVTKSAEGNPMLKSLEPDLIGEYFVLNFLRDQVADERYRERIRLFWEKPWPYAYFLERCVDSYLSQQEFQELLDENKTVFWYKKGNELAAHLSAMLTVNLITEQDAVAGAESVERLRKLSQEEYVMNENIALAYAKGLLNLSNKQALSGRKASVERLRKLSDQYAANKAIALEYVKGLFNLSNVQDLSGRKESVEHMRELSGQYAGNEEIALEYAKGLVNLSIAQDLSGRKANVERLWELSARYKKNEAIALAYAKGLFNLSTAQDLSGRKASVERLWELSARYKKNEEIVLEYAKGLVNLSTTQDLSDCKASVERLWELSARYKKNEEIVLEYAKGLFNLTTEQDRSSTEANVKCLGELSGEYAENEAIALVYAQGLVNLSADQDLSGCKASVERLWELSARYKKNEAIALAYARGLFNLSTEQDLSGRKASMERLGELSVQYAGNEAIALECAKGLVHMGLEQDLSGLKASVERLGELSVQYAGNEGIALAYAQGLAILSIKQDMSGCRASVERLGKLSDQYAGNEEIALVYAKGLVILSIKQDLSGCKTSVERLGELSRQYAENEEIALEYAKGLAYLGNKQDLSGLKASVECLGELSHQYAENEKIALLYAEDLAWLCAKERSEKIVIQECQAFYASWQADSEAVRQVVSAEPDGNMKTLKLFLLEHTELFPEFMEWLVS